MLGRYGSLARVEATFASGGHQGACAWRVTAHGRFLMWVLQGLTSLDKIQGAYLNLNFK